MSEESLGGSDGVLRRAVWGSLLGWGVFIVSAGLASEGVLRALGILLGALVGFSAFTPAPRRLTGRLSRRSSPRTLCFWAIWTSGVAIVVPLLLAAVGVFVLAIGVPMDLTFASMIVGPALCSLLNLVVLLSNLLGRRSA